jgi:hypothetical protein
MARTYAISLLRKVVTTLCVLWSLLDVRAATPGSSDDQEGNIGAHESWKDYWTDRGITISPEWDADIFVNARGGIKQGAETNGLIRLGLDLDCQRITKLSVNINAVTRPVRVVKIVYQYGLFPHAL